MPLKYKHQQLIRLSVYLVTQQTFPTYLNGKDRSSAPYPWCRRTSPFRRHGKQAMRFLSEIGNMVTQGGGSERSFVRQVRAELSCAPDRRTGTCFDECCPGVGRSFPGRV